MPRAELAGQGEPKGALSRVFLGLEGGELVPQGRIELPTSSLPMTRSTTELLRRSVIGGELDAIAN